MTNISAIQFGSALNSLEGKPLELGAAGKLQRSELIDAIRYLHLSGVLTNGRSANASVRLIDNPNHVLVSARGLPKDITEDDFGVVTLDGDFVSGRLGKGVRSVISMHTHAYNRAGVGSVIHTHSLNATAFAVAHQEIPLHYEPLLTRGQTVPVPVSPYGERNSGGLVDSLDNFLQSHPKTKSVLLANHGLLVFDETPEKAAQLAVTIDEAAGIFLRAKAIGGSKPFPIGGAE